MIAFDLVLLYHFPQSGDEDIRMDTDQKSTHSTIGEHHGETGYQRVIHKSPQLWTVIYPFEVKINTQN